MADMHDVAKKAGVSVATVSRYLHHPEKLRPATSLKVARAIETTGYQPNFLARNLRTKRSYSILVIVPDIANAFFSEVIKGIEEVAVKHGYSVLLGDASYDKAREDDYAQIARTKRADGVIQLSGRIPTPIASLVESGAVPFVAACETVPDSLGSSVGIDNVDAAKRLTRLLIDLDHRRLALITGPTENQHTIARLKGVHKAIEASGEDVEIVFTAEGDYSVQSGYDVIARQINMTLPDAIFCFSDQMAIGAMRRLAEKGIEVPKNVSIAGFDDIELARFMTPSLTTVSQPARQIGNEAALRLFSQMESETPETVNVELTADIIIRESTVRRSG